MRMKRIFTLCISLLLLGTAAFAQVDETFQFVDAQGNVVENGATIVIDKLEEGQMNTGLAIKNTTTADAAGVMKCDISSMPNGTFQSCAFGQCLSPWNSAGQYDSYKAILSGNSQPQPILTEWIPETYGEWTCTLQLVQLNIESQSVFGIVQTKVGTEEIGYGPKITVKFVYQNPAGIDAPTASLQPTARYNLGGQKLTAAKRGLNIVRMSDGSTRKTIVK